MPSLCLPPIDLLKTWNDPILLNEQPFLDVFESWKCQQWAGVTRSMVNTRVDSLVNELCSAGIQKPLQHWVNMTFKGCPGYDWQAIVKLFVEYQWTQFSNDQDAAMRFLRRECGGLGLSFEPAKASDRTASVMYSTIPSGNHQKRKSAVDRPGIKRPRTEPAANDSITMLVAMDQVTTTTPQKRITPYFHVQSGPTKRFSQPATADAPRLHLRRHQNSTSAARSGKTGSKLKEKQPATTRKTQDKPYTATISTQRENKRGRTKGKKKTSSKLMQSVKEEPCGSYISTTTGVKAKNKAVILQDIPESEATIPEAFTATMMRVSNDLPDHSSNVVMEPDSTVDVAIMSTVGLVSSQSQASPESLLARPRNWLNEPTEETKSAVSSVQKSESLEEPASFTTYGPAVRPPLPNYPPIWAQSRQEVCESFDWFRSYQGGVYYTRGTARGYLLSSFSARRDIFGHGGKLIISHGGGKAQSVHSHLGQSVTQEADDQLAQDKSVRALLANYRSRRPLVLLIDDRYPLFPYELGLKDITYAILGFYTIIHAWAEYQPAGNQRGKVVRYKFAFQWCESQGEPWWLNPGVSLQSAGDGGPVGTNIEEPVCVDQSVAPFEHIEQISTICPTCNKSSPQVYTRAWACFNPDCPTFWQGPDGLTLGDELEYNPDFLQLAPATSLAIPVEKLEPAPPLPSSLGPTTDYAYTRGWHCKKCGRLSCRFKWEHWECKHCREILHVKGRIREAAEFLYLSSPVPHHDCIIANGSEIYLASKTTFRLSPDDNNFGQCLSYKLPGTRGFIHHIKLRNPLLNREADELFCAYQEQASAGALPFRRWPMRAHKCRGQLLTNYFSQNAGVPYRYVGGTENTLPFDRVPDAVIKARDLIQTRIRQALHRDVSFNEVLSAAYMERQSMAFHTDDEIGLGPFVAGLSLGSPAVMHFRLLARHAPQGTQRSIAISFTLRHGDVLAMDGGGVQQFYEHTVVPTNFRIAATARQIDTIHPKHEDSS